VFGPAARSWKLTGCIGGTYVFDEQRGSASQQKKAVGHGRSDDDAQTRAANTAPAPAKPTT
jgi:hypothetical protein